MYTNRKTVSVICAARILLMLLQTLPAGIATAAGANRAAGKVPTGSISIQNALKKHFPSDLGPGGCHPFGAERPGAAAAATRRAGARPGGDGNGCEVSPLDPWFYILTKSSVNTKMKALSKALSQTK